MEKGKKKLIIRIMSTAAVLAAAIAICTFVAKRTTEEVEASTKVLQKVSEKYTSGSSFKILEVVPGHTAHENEEIGYFMSDGNNSNRDFMGVSKAKSIGSFLDSEGISHLMMMRDYGLIKDMGKDYGDSGDSISDNPIYSDKATFLNNPTSGYELVDKQNRLVAGVYSMDSGLAGDYKLEDGYFIDSSGTINVQQGVVSDNNVPVSNNSIGGGALTRTLAVITNTDGVTEEETSGEEPAVNQQDEITITIEDDEPEQPEPGNGNEENHSQEETPGQPEESTEEEEQPGNMLQNIEGGVDANPSSQGTYGGGYYQRVGDASYEPVAEGDRFNKQLPEGITWLGDGTGNVKFVESSAGKYYGYPANDIYYNNEGSNLYHNGNWFKELIFGDKDININISIETKTPGEVGNWNGYDLIYISGRNEAYINQGVDFSESQVVELYNAVIGDSHQAVIMDYALIDTNSIVDRAATGHLSHLEKLALLLWQSDQMAILTETISENGTGGTAEHNGFEVTVASGAGAKVTGMTGYAGVSNNIWHYLTSMISLNGYGNFVAGSVYVYEHRLGYFNSPKALVDTYDFFGNGDFNSQYSNPVVAAGLSQVEYTIKVNNVNYPTEKMSERVTPAVVVQYILSYDGTASALVKNELRVLEIEPCRDFSFNMGWGSQTYTEIKNSSFSRSWQNTGRDNVLKNREAFIEAYLGEPFYKDGAVDMINIDYIQFTSMTIEEFICINDNIREEYDIIYIGSNHSANPSYETYNGTGTGQYNVISNQLYTQGSELPEMITNFRDDQMDGMVYFNIGDLIHVQQFGLAGTAWNLSLWGSLENNTELKNGGVFRMSARDLTAYMKKELLDYLDTGYPIIVAGDMLKTDASGNRVINPTKCVGHDTENGYDHGRIDNSSVMYEFFQVATGQSTNAADIGSYSASGYSNFISEADVQNGTVDKEEIVKAVNAAKLSMNITARPTEYEYTADNIGRIVSQTSLAAEADGKYYLDFEFTLQNISTNSQETDIYNPHLYVDVNADGKFSEQEELEGAVVTNALTGVEVPYTTTIRGNTYSLSTNVLYRLRREVPDGFQGVLPWCLKVAKYTDPKVSDSETGYSAIKGVEATPIKILQIMKDYQGDVTLNLQYSIASNTDRYGWYINALDDLDMFKLEVTAIPMSTFQYPGAYIKDGVHYNYWEELEDFDMLVLGFADNYPDISRAEAVNGLEQYVRSGRPVLLTHDFLEHYPNYNVVKQLRGLLGMDRYGVTDKVNLPAVSAGSGYARSDPSDAAAIAQIEGSGKRVAYQPGSNKQTLLGETQGFTTYIVTKYQADAGANIPGSNAVRKYRYLISPDVDNWTVGANQDYLMFVDKINDGQIANYPYKLPDAFAVNKTHGQYFQPDMEADQDQDGTPDITIWYTLAYGHSLGDPNSESSTSKLSDGVYNIAPKDGVNNYYIFNSGNVTYTGSGHSTLTWPINNYEAQLFVNTLVAAYRAGIKNPTVTMYEGSDLNSSAITNIVVPYDENIGVNADITNNQKAESSILKDSAGNYRYPFVGITDANATRAYFRVSDPNMVKGSKNVKLKFYREVPNNTPGAVQITLNNGDIATVIEVPMNFYSADFINTYAYGTDATAGVMYGLKLPMELLKSSSDFKLYVEAQTEIISVSITGDSTTQESGKSYASLGVTKMDLLKLD